MIKKIFFLLSLLSITFYSFSQTEKGVKILSGELSYFSDSNDNESLTVIPSFGYFVSDNLAIGVGLGFSSRTFGFSGNQSNSFVLNPFIRKFVPIDDGKFYFHLEGGARFLFFDDDFRVFQLGISPGFSYFFTSKWSIDLFFEGISYRFSGLKGEMDDRAFNFGLDLLAPGVRINFLF